MRHPASAYVQGINDLAAPLLMAFLEGTVCEQKLISQKLDPMSIEQNEALANSRTVTQKTPVSEILSEENILDLDQETFIGVEADVFWCLSKLIDDVQDNYTDMQPGVHKCLNKMRAVVE